VRAKYAATSPGELPDFDSLLRTHPFDVHGPGALAATLREVRPHLVVHSAGPFQGQGYAVARTCAAAGVHYVDLADGADFVCGFSAALDALAKERQVVLLTSASSVPALPSAAMSLLIAQLKLQKEASSPPPSAQPT
jgi:saccharopine dehydrogenase-like NADP-dependent oxidoreductase